MILALLLELLAALPTAAEDIVAAVHEAKSKDPTGEKVAKIGAVASQIATAASTALDKPGG